MPKAIMCKSSHNDVLLLQIECKWCLVKFFLCRSCYSGQCYCCERCRTLAQKTAHRKSQSKYRKSEKGRQANKTAEKRRRINKNTKSVADEGSTPPPSDDILHPVLLSQNPKCLICGASGQVVTRFPRRGYGSTFKRGHKISKIGRVTQKKTV